MRERAVRYGTASLFGILCEPTRDQRLENTPCIIVLNAGLLHKVGACRLHVKLARALAAAGYTTFRFDFSGIGDSDVRPDSLSFDQSAPAEVRETMDYLVTTKKVKSFVLIGLCSGADMAFAVAQADPESGGIVQLDPFAYRTWTYLFYRFGPKLRRWESWRNVLVGKTYIGRYVRRWFSRDGAGHPTPGASDLVISPYIREFPPQQVVARGLQSLVDRKVRVFNIFSGGQEQHYNHKSQYVRSFGGIRFDGLLRVEYIPEADHVFTHPDHQQFVNVEVPAWVANYWPGTAVAEDTRKPAGQRPSVAV